MEHLLSAWAKIGHQLKYASHILLLADYDGTLTPIVQRPELANLSKDTRLLLKALSHQQQLTLAIISGRALTDLKHKVRIRDIIYAGNHGLEIEGPGINFVYPMAKEIIPILDVLHSLLSQSLRAIEGALVENKGLSLSVHYREVTEDKIEEVKNILERVAASAQASGTVRITTGKKMYEIRPTVDWNKGNATELLMQRYGKGDRKSELLSIFLGDDLTDEDAFKVIEDYENGISVAVGNTRQNTIARYFLESPDEVVKFLGMLLNQRLEC
ncbi:trehalose-phosphatase [Chloroflexota bacterium]